MNQSIFREYDIRGIVETDLTDDVVYNLGKAYATLMARRGKTTLVCGHDLRLSSSHIQSLFIQGMIETGAKVLNIGQVTTPALYFAILYLSAQGGTMITGSHNPIEFNGFKMCEGIGSVFGQDIQLIKKMILDNDYDLKPGGQQKTIDVLPHYINMLKNKFTMKRRLKIVVDAGNATAGPIAPDIWRSYGLEVVELYCEPDGSFPNHLPDPTVPKYMKDLQEKVVSENADLGLGYDGDADRVGAVDDKGRLIFADTLLTLFSRDVLKRKPDSQIIFDVKCSQSVETEITRAGGRPLMYKTGHSLLKAKMKETGAPFAGEMSGHMFFADDYYGFDDGIYASGRLLEIISNSDKSFSQMVDELPHFVSTPEIRVDCADQKKFMVVETLADEFRKKFKVIDIDGARVQFDHGWGLVRASNTQPTLVLRFEAQTKDHLLKIMDVFKEKLASIPAIKFSDKDFDLNV